MKISGEGFWYSPRKKKNLKQTEEYLPLGTKFITALEKEGASAQKTS